MSAKLLQQQKDIFSLIGKIYNKVILPEPELLDPNTESRISDNRKYEKN